MEVTLWVYFGYTLGILWVYFEYSLGILWVYFIWVYFIWVYVGYTLGTLWVYFGYKYMSRIYNLLYLGYSTWRISIWGILGDEKLSYSK